MFFCFFLILPLKSWNFVLYTIFMNTPVTHSINTSPVSELVVLNKTVTTFYRFCYYYGQMYLSDFILMDRDMLQSISRGSILHLCTYFVIHKILDRFFFFLTLYVFIRVKLSTAPKINAEQKFVKIDIIYQGIQKNQGKEKQNLFKNFLFFYFLNEKIQSGKFSNNITKFVYIHNLLFLLFFTLFFYIPCYLLKF